MTDRSVTHGSFSVERTYPAAPQRVFAAWATLEAKTHGSAGATTSSRPRLSTRWTSG
jgi:uncharacterized protein YndB with AHSA1/START domain